MNMKLLQHASFNNNFFWGAGGVTRTSLTIKEKGRDERKTE